jgi:UrcA family protein
MNSLKKASFITILAGLAIAAPAAAFAEGADTVVQGSRDSQSATVSFADLNLASANGLETLRGRVHRVATSLCIETGSKDLRTAMLGQACVKSAVAGAEPQIARASEAYRAGQAASADTISVRRAL